MLFKHIFRHFLWEGVGGLNVNILSIFCTFILLLNIVLFNRFAVCNFDALSIWKCFPRTLIKDPNIRDHFSIIVITYKNKNKTKPEKTNKKQNKNCYNKSVNARIRGQFSICTHYNVMFFKAIKQVATCVRDIYLKYYIFKEILMVNLSFFYYIINQKRKWCVNHFPLSILPFSH